LTIVANKIFNITVDIIILYIIICIWPYYYEHIVNNFIKIYKYYLPWASEKVQIKINL